MIMEMKSKTAFCDYFVVMSAPSTVRVKSICDFIEDTMKGEGHALQHKEGYQDGLWVLLDFGAVIAHVFIQETRGFYDIENLWGDVPKKPYLAHERKR